EIENYISANTSSGNVAVSVIDNKTGKKYNTGSAFSVYSAWGFYLPIYLLWPSEGIMSSDPGVCNSAANNAIEYLGGTASVTSLLRNNYSLTSTTYGRKFGDTTSVADNFTSSSDAVYLLSVLYSRGESTRLCYDYSKFGVSAPAGSTMYAQVGTENIGRKEKLNVFAIIKGASSNYCVAVLTEGYNSSLITPILGKIHNQMESL
ncbi:MAG: hypothetical protein IJN59_01035, partial [Oscillospiraceae bacterium]|nr:hypothetical protein [Oscillospiraceae bacterium]